MQYTRELSRCDQMRPSLKILQAKKSSNPTESGIYCTAFTSTSSPGATRTSTVIKKMKKKKKSFAPKQATQRVYTRNVCETNIYILQFLPAQTAVPLTNVLAMPSSTRRRRRFAVQAHGEKKEA